VLRLNLPRCICAIQQHCAEGSERGGMQQCVEDGWFLSIPCRSYQELVKHPSTTVSTRGASIGPSVAGQGIRAGVRCGSRLSRSWPKFYLIDDLDINTSPTASRRLSSRFLLLSPSLASPLHQCQLQSQNSKTRGHIHGHRPRGQLLLE
jgi:hypothetical protein